MNDVVVIGSGPGGVSAAVYALRAGLSVMILGKDGGALGQTELLENYYGFPEPITGEELLTRGLAQAERLGARIVHDEIVSLAYEDSLVAVGLEGSYPAKTVILATGAQRKTPPLPGLRELEGAGVSYCAICDAFFYRGKDVAVLGAGEYALHEAADLLPVAGSVTLLTNGAPVPDQLPDGLRVDTRAVAALDGQDKLHAVRFADGDTLPVEGIFIALGVAGSDALARKLGALTEGGRILVDAHMATNIPGLFAAGDCTGGLKQIIKAAHEGAIAGMAAAKFIRTQK